MLIGHMIVGPGEAGRYLADTLDRARQWADVMTVYLDSNATEAERSIVEDMIDVFAVSKRTWEHHEGKFRQAAWDWMAEAVNPSPEDHVMLIDADEVVFDGDLLRAASREFPGRKLGFRFHEMWSFTHYRSDGNWKPYVAQVCIPFQVGGRFKDRPIASGREPMYSSNVMSSGAPITDILHYGYARTKDKMAKYERYMRLDGGAYHNLGHLQSILHPPTLTPWTKGGLLGAR